MKIYHKRTINLKEIGFKNYRQYLLSDLWSTIRQCVLLKHKYCVRCNRKATQVHHMTYSVSVLRGEDFSKLLSVCRKCHKYSEIRHKKKKKTVHANRVFLKIGCAICGRPIASGRKTCKRCRCEFRGKVKDLTKLNFQSLFLKTDPQ